MLLMLMVVLSTRCSQQWFQSERTGPSLHSWGIPAMNITCQSACISYPNRDNYADQMTMITWTIWFDQFMSPEQIFESSWTSFMPCITFKSTPTDLTPVKIILHQIFQSAPCEDGGAAAALRRSPRYRRHAGHHQCSSEVIQPNFQQPCHHDESVIGSMFIDHLYHATPKKVFPESVQ